MVRHACFDRSSSQCRSTVTEWRESSRLYVLRAPSQVSHYFQHIDDGRANSLMRVLLLGHLFLKRWRLLEECSELISQIQWRNLQELCNARGNVNTRRTGTLYV